MSNTVDCPTFAGGINAKGEITGLYCSFAPPPPVGCPPLVPFSAPTHGFLRRPGGEIVSFDAPIAPIAATTVSVLRSVASINDAGAITESYAFGAPTGRVLTFGFVRDPDGKFTSFRGNFNSNFTLPTSINNKGAITGWVSITPLFTGPISGFVRSPEGTITMFDPPFCLAGENPPSRITMPTSINDEGVITGFCANGGGVGWVRFP